MFLLFHCIGVAFGFLGLVVLVSARGAIHEAAALLALGISLLSFIGGAVCWRLWRIHLTLEALASDMEKRANPPAIPPPPPVPAPPPIVEPHERPTAWDRLPKKG